MEKCNTCSRVNKAAAQDICRECKDEYIIELEKEIERLKDK